MRNPRSKDVASPMRKRIRFVIGSSFDENEEHDDHHHQPWLVSREKEIDCLRLVTCFDECVIDFCGFLVDAQTRS